MKHLVIFFCSLTLIAAKLFAQDASPNAAQVISPTPLAERVADDGVVDDHVLELPAKTQQEREEEKDRIDAARGELEASYMADKRACYQYFNVSSCLIQARDKYLEARAVLRKEELAYLERERQFKNQEATDRRAEKNSEENQRKAQEQREQSVKEAQQRRDDNAQKQIDHNLTGNKRDQYDQKQKEAQDHRQSVQDQIKDRDKPAAAPLPLPPEVQK